MNRADAVEELKQLYTILNADVRVANDAALTDPTEFNMRTLVRTCFALIEGLAYQIRHVTLASLQGTDILSEGELAILKEVKYQLSDNGSVKRGNNFQAMLPQLLFTLRVYAKNHGADFVPKTSDKGWTCLKEAVTIRDRLMHPKSLQDLSISDAERETFAAGVKWWDDMVLALLLACENADKKLLQADGSKADFVEKP
jgi:hypothetical protein